MLHRIVLPIVFGTLLAFPLVAQKDSIAVRFANTITVDELREHLTILASDAYLGRDTGKEGQKMAAAYLKKQFQQAGIPPVTAGDVAQISEGYFQSYELIEEKSGSISMVTSRDTLRLKEGLIYFTENLTEDRDLNELRWLGNGTGKAMQKSMPAGVLLWEDGSRDSKELMAWLRAKVEEVRLRGAAVVLVATPRMPELLQEFGHYIGGTRVQLKPTESGSDKAKPGTQLILVDEKAIDGMLVKGSWARLARKRAGRKLAVRCTLKRQEQRWPLVAENVLAYIEGTDKKDELVVLTAHYDHIGVEDGVVYNGADDDGSGTVALIEIAEAFAAAKAAGHGPRRSVLVMPVSGEEKGLLGSRYYSDHPVFPLDMTVADLNIDMIGRTDSAHSNSAPYVYVIGSDRLSSELHAVNEAANRDHVQIELDYQFNAESDPNRFYYRSDHYNFARKGVPSIFYFSGVHEDYHQPSDDVEKIQFDLLHQRALLVFHTAWMLANQEKRIVVDKAAKP